MSEAEAPPKVFDWKESARALVKALAKALAWSVVVGVTIIVVSFLLNLVLSAAFFVMAPLMGGGHGSWIGFLVALIPFAPFVALAVVVAQKQGLTRLLAAGVESQGPTIARVGSHWLGDFMTGRYGDLKQTKVGGAVDKGWQHYLRSRTEAPWMVRFLVARVTSRVPLCELIDDLVERGTPSEKVPEEVMRYAVTHVAQEKMAPSPVVPLALFGINILWFPVVQWVIWPLLSR